MNLQKREEQARRRRRTWGHGGVAQMGEHLPCKQGVDSSILFISTNGSKTEISDSLETCESESHKGS